MRNRTCLFFMTSLVGACTTAPVIEPASPSPASTAPGTAQTLCLPSQPQCIGLLAADTHRADRFDMPFSYTVPDGWSKDLELPTAFNLVTEAAAGGFLGMWPDFAAATSERCSRTAAPGVGRTAADIVGWLGAHPGLVTSEPTAATMGGFAGLTIEVEGEPGWTNPCSDPAGGVDPHVLGQFSLLVATADDGGWIAITDRARAAVSVVDTDDGHTLTIYLEADKPAFDKFVSMAAPVVESIEFSP